MGCKVDTIAERHNLAVPDPGYESVDDYLVQRWTGTDGRPPDGYKTLTEWFNKRLLRHLYEVNGRDAVSIHLDREYEVITGEDDVQRAELAADLSTDGLEIDAIDDQMVSWSTMRHHLKDCLGAEKEVPQATTDWEMDTVRMAIDTTTEKTQSVLSSLTSKGRLPDADEADVDVQVKLSCPECSVRVPLEDALDRGYVCETHLTADAEPEPPSESRVGNTLSAIALPFLALETAQAFLYGEAVLVEVATAAAV